MRRVERLTGHAIQAAMEVENRLVQLIRELGSVGGPPVKAVISQG
jgi:hypothetical protein